MNIAAPAHATIVVDVQFYDTEEKRKLLDYHTAAVMQRLVADPIEVPKAEFLTYYLFHRIKLGTADYQDYQSVAKRLYLWLGAIGECIDYQGNSVRTPEGAARQLTEVSEHIGEAIGLAVMNRIHGLTEADWRPIPEQRGRGAAPSFDFQLASDGESFIQVETKGSSVYDNRVLSEAVKAQKRKIDEKKQKLSALTKQGNDPHPASLRYGTLTAVDARENGNIRCWLTDPPPEPVDDTPQRFKLLNRMRHLRDWIAFISPRSPLAAAVATRVADLEAMANPFELGGVPLRRGSGEPFQFEPFNFATRRHSTFMASKSRVTDGPAGGVVVQLSGSELLFLGIREQLLTLATNQEFQDIERYKADVDSLNKIVECTFSVGRFRGLRLPPSVRQSATQTGGYFHFPLRGTLHYSAEGLVFGLLPLPQQ